MLLSVAAKQMLHHVNLNELTDQFHQTTFCLRKSSIPESASNEAYTVFIFVWLVVILPCRINFCLVIAQIKTRFSPSVDYLSFLHYVLLNWAHLFRHCDVLYYWELRIQILDISIKYSKDSNKLPAEKGSFLLVGSPCSTWWFLKESKCT